MANFLATLRSTPLWVKVFGIIVIVLVLLFVINRLTGLHTPPGGPGGHRPPIEQEGHQP